MCFVLRTSHFLCFEEKDNKNVKENRMTVIKPSLINAIRCLEENYAKWTANQEILDRLFTHKVLKTTMVLNISNMNFAGS